MQHQAGVSCRPAGTIRELLTDKAVFSTNTVVAELGLVEQVTKALIEFPAVLVVTNRDHAVLNTEGVTKIDACRGTDNLWRPILEITPVEHFLPLFEHHGNPFRRLSVSAVTSHQS